MAGGAKASPAAEWPFARSNILPRCARSSTSDCRSPVRLACRAPVVCWYEKMSMNTRKSAATNVAVLQAHLSEVAPTLRLGPPPSGEADDAAASSAEGAATQTAEESEVARFVGQGCCRKADSFASPADDDGRLSRWFEAPSNASTRTRRVFLASSVAECRSACAANGQCDGFEVGGCAAGLFSCQGTCWHFRAEGRPERLVARCPANADDTRCFAMGTGVARARAAVRRSLCSRSPRMPFTPGELVSVRGGLPPTARCALRPPKRPPLSSRAPPCWSLAPVSDNRLAALLPCRARA